MSKHQNSDNIIKDLDAMLSKLNALDIISENEFQKGVTKILRKLVEAQINSTNEFEHIKKALDLLTLEVFELKNIKS